MTKQIFEGLRVADFCWAAAGPQVGRELAEHGATVIRVESHRRLDILRSSPPFKDSIPTFNRSAFFTQYNANKYGISLDLGNPRAREVTRRLISWADIVGESMGPGAMAKLGLDYESCRKINPQIIYFSTCMLGQYGPHRDFRGVGTHVNALGGFCAVTGWPDSEPTQIFTAYSDYISPWYTLIAVMGALLRRRKTGVGMYMEQSQLEAAVSFLGPHVLDYAVNHNLLNRRGNRDRYMSPHGVYPCRGSDRWVALAVTSDEDWQRLCHVMGNPEWTKDPRYDSVVGRKENEDEVDRLIGDWTKDFLPEQVLAMLQGAGIAAGVVQTGDDLLGDPQLKHREHYHALNHPVIGSHSYHAPAYRLSQTPCVIDKPAPCVGEHNQYVYKDILGFSDDEIADMLVNGVITTDADAPTTVTVS